MTTPGPEKRNRLKSRFFTRTAQSCRRRCDHPGAALHRVEHQFQLAQDRHADVGAAAFDEADLWAMGNEARDSDVFGQARLIEPRRRRWRSR